MQDYKKFVSILLQKVESFSKSLSNEDILRIVNGKALIKMSVDSSDASPKDSKEKKSTSTFSSEDTEALIRKLHDAQSREDGYLFLKDIKRKGLEAIAQQIDIPVRKSDKVSMLVEKIIEATIGFRLRSRAIKGDAADIDNEIYNSVKKKVLRKLSKAIDRRVENNPLRFIEMFSLESKEVRNFDKVLNNLVTSELVLLNSQFIRLTDKGQVELNSLLNS